MTRGFQKNSAFSEYMTIRISNTVKCVGNQFSILFELQFQICKPGSVVVCRNKQFPRQQAIKQVSVKICSNIFQMSVQYQTTMPACILFQDSDHNICLEFCYPIDIGMVEMHSQQRVFRRSSHPPLQKRQVCRFS